MKCPTWCDLECPAVCHEVHVVHSKRLHELEDCPGYEGPLGACMECGNDDPTEGYRYCQDCLEKLHP